MLFWAPHCYPRPNTCTKSRILPLAPDLDGTVSPPPDSTLPGYLTQSGGRGALRVTSAGGVALPEGGSGVMLRTAGRVPVGTYYGEIMAAGPGGRPKVALIVALLTALKELYLDNPVFGTPGDYLEAFIWGFAVKAGLEVGKALVKELLSRIPPRRVPA
ncbi:MAG TPA: hypothetical protein VHG28_12050 [Longimicrobiaceae bacterium]|nr:hypothetical protein [Longimicrobiaceae bacterium]